MKKDEEKEKEKPFDGGGLAGDGDDIRVGGDSSLR